MAETAIEKEERIKITFKDAITILTPYTWEKMREQLSAVLPISIYLILFQLFILWTGVPNAWGIGFGILAVIIGLMFFMEGLRLGLMPFGETIGNSLPAKATMPVLLGFAFIVGFGATLAEPAIGTLKAAGSMIKPNEAPLLYDLLNARSTFLVVAVGIGVGFASLVGTLRFLYSWRLGILIIPSVIVAAIMTIVAFINPETRPIIGLAWDCGGVTTGPVTVPLVLSLGIGVAAATGKSDTGMAGFGVVTLASLFPIIMVIGLGFVLYYFGISDIEAIKAIVVGNINQAPSIWDNPFVSAIRFSIQAIVPLFLFLYFFQKLYLKEKIAKAKMDEIWLGITFAVIGMILFNIGLNLGLSPIGGSVGGTIPGAFKEIEGMKISPIYIYPVGVAIAILFGLLMGYGATLAEPALNALGLKVQEITVGAFKKQLLMQSVAVGVALGIGLGVVKFIWNIELIYLLLPPYFVLLFITSISKESFVNIGWDSAGVTTGPITVPLVLAMGLGIGQAIGIKEGFGILALASVCPIMTVLTLGLIVGRQPKEKGAN